MVVWIIGLSGAGKTTLAKEIVKEVSKSKSVVLLDGDVVRDIFANDLGHSLDDRLTNAQRICQLGKLLDDQGVHVVCAILSLFPETRAWNRENLKSYHEVYIDAPVCDLVSRDSKGIYSRYNKGEICDVAGMDLKFIPPESPDMIISNVGSKDKLLGYAKSISEIIINE